MRVFIVFLAFIWADSACFAQGLNESIYNETMAKISGKSTSERLVSIAKSFLNQPYVSKTLEGNETEKLVVNLQQFDCSTLVEQCLAMAQSNNYTDFKKKLTKLRYLNGKIDGYGSRIHYLTEWLIEHENDGTFVNLTKSIGGEKYVKNVNFMTENPKYYPKAKDDKTWEKIQKSEDRINETQQYFIPKNKVEGIKSKIKSGDIIAITTSKNGLDCAHQGIALWVNDKLHLLHASYDFKEVIISKEPLVNYLKNNKLQSGIMVVRLK